jgi:hypothetical protein
MSQLQPNRADRRKKVGQLQCGLVLALKKGIIGVSGWCIITAALAPAFCVTAAAMNTSCANKNQKKAQKN